MKTVAYALARLEAIRLGGRYAGVRRSRFRRRPTGWAAWIRLRDRLRKGAETADLGQGVDTSRMSDAEFIALLRR